MEFFNQFYLNYYGIATIISCFQWSLCAIFLFRLSNRSEFANNLLIISFASLISCIGYIFSHSLLQESGIGRIITYSSAFLVHVYYLKLIYNFPELHYPRLYKYSFRIFLTIGIILMLYDVFYGFLFWKVEFNPDSHYYETLDPLFYKISGAIMLLLVFNYISYNVFAIIKFKGKQRNTYILSFIALSCIGLIPAIINFLNKYGIITRSVFMSYFIVITLIGFFIIMILFINNTTDRTTFIFKIVSVGFLTFVLIFNIIANIVFHEREESYNKIHVSELKQIIDSEIQTNDLAYILEVDLINNNTLFMNDLENKIKFDDSYTHERIKTYYITQLLNAKTEENKKEFIKTSILKENKYTLGFQNFILPKISELNNQTILSQIESKKNYIYIRETKIKEMSNENFRIHLEKFLNQESIEFKPFKDIIESELKSSSLEGKELKNEILRIISLPKTLDQRKYRVNSLNKEKFYCYNYFHAKTNKFYEVGFTYIGYREYIHSIGIKLFYLLTTGILIFVLGVPIFLSKALINPLMNLLNGLKKIRRGDLDVEVEVQVQDEIGFLASSFNTMVQAIKDAKIKLEEYSHGLEQKVEKRTEELKNSLDTVNKLKVKQDGDYFLTSLLIEPFVTNISDSKNFKVDFFINQKKKFMFHDKELEIGGDLCSIQNLELNHKKYIVFCNSDAMGKSLQGAGGAIVFGSVFYSIIQRTNQIINQKDSSPERWLKNTFLELHKIFLAFEGSMLVSTVLGLIEEDTGLMYYLNAEHPWIVLYRDGICEFIESKTHFYKLGSPMNSKKIFISMLKLQQNDIVIIGSDGRDDFANLNETEDSNSLERNSDEREFLNIVKEAEGDLDKIYKKTLERGVITDDYSLIRIQSNLTIPDKSELKKEIKSQYDSKNFLTAIAFAEEYLETAPWDSEVLFTLGYLYRKTQNYAKSAYYLERMRLREPENLKNLFNLTRTHIELGNLIRAEEILLECIQIDPTHKDISKIENLIRALKEVSREDKESLFLD
ncbi:MAG: SpoIIE family protein phosphatase [Leptospiraceae bacterium]|nr:SpoIIE family protein phosphatase [Leptospiraceae bacterium]